MPGHQSQDRRVVSRSTRLSPIRSAGRWPGCRRYEAAHDPQFFADRVFVPVEDGSNDPYLTINSPVRLDQEQKVPPRPAPDLGEHTQAVLSELGFDPAAINDLHSAGAVPKK